MATKRTRRTPKAKVPVAAAPTPEAPSVVVHAGWDHDWRNSEAVFAADDHCPNADLARLGRR